jgi:DUF4097 and DUF4098 domain-containing protein YvlB
MRRGSLVGPVLIIAIGAWLLACSLRPDLRMFEVAAMYWPWLLVGWGALRILEILRWKMQGRPVPQSGISGGEWVIILFLCFIGSGLYAMNRFSSGHYGFIRANRIEIFGHSFDYPVAEKRISAKPNCRVIVENLRGNARLTGGDVNEIVVGGRKSIRALREPDAASANRQSEVELSDQGTQIVVRTNTDRVTGEQKVTTDLEVTVPRGATVEFRGRDGEIEINDLNGPVEVTSDRAEIRLHNLGGKARINVQDAKLVRASDLKGDLEIAGGHGGDIELDGVAGEVTIDGSYSGDLQFRNLARPIRMTGPTTELRAEKVPGEIRMDLDKFSANDVAGPLKLTSSRSRDVQIEQFTSALELSVRGGDITLRPAVTPLPKIDARTRDGNVELVLPENGKFTLKAVSNRGEVTNDYGSALKTVSDESGGHRRGARSIVSGETSGPAITVETERGSISVRKDAGAALVQKQGGKHADRVELDTDKAKIEIEKN